MDDSEYDNPWKESVKQLYRGIHVRQGFQEMYTDSRSGRNILCVDTIQSALSMGGDNPLIFIHTNKYAGELLIIDTNAEVSNSVVYFSQITRYIQIELF